MTKLSSLPRIVAHADWSKDAKKRWVAVAELNSEDRFIVRSVEPVGDLSTYFQRLRNRSSQPSTVLAGFDFPIGLPHRYAQTSGIDDFVAFLPQFGEKEWSDFYRLAETEAEISPKRPFYPRACSTKGSVTQEALYRALGATEMSELLRACERPSLDRQAASPLFWTLGGKQVGRAAIAGWQDLLAPAIASGERIRIWPFQGTLAQNLAEGNVVVVETYPAEYYHHLQLYLGPVAGAAKFGKRVQASRAANAEKILDWASRHGIQLEADVINTVKDGFGNRSDGEDRFDAFIGLLGMLEVLIRGTEPEVGVSPSLAKVEGWIFGQAATFLQSPRIR